MALRPELWHPAKGLKLVLEGTVQGIRPVYEHIVERHVPGETVVVASTLGLGARVAQDKLGIPTATVQLQPSILRSVHESPRLPGSPIRSWQPAWFQRARRSLWFTLWMMSTSGVTEPTLPVTSTVTPPSRRS